MASWTKGDEKMENLENTSSVGICAEKSKRKIVFFPQADTNPDKSYEVSELFWRLLKKNRFLN